METAVGRLSLVLLTKRYSIHGLGSIAPDSTHTADSPMGIPMGESLRASIFKQCTLFTCCYISYRNRLHQYFLAGGNAQTINFKISLCNLIFPLKYLFSLNKSFKMMFKKTPFVIGWRLYQERQGRSPVDALLQQPDLLHSMFLNIIYEGVN